MNTKPGMPAEHLLMLGSMFIILLILYVEISATDIFVLLWILFLSVKTMH